MIRATLQQLRVFQAVAEHRSFTKAAEVIHLTQPGVSIQVKRLEEILGVSLFEKVGNQIYLTAEGKALFATCHDLFERLAVFEEELASIHGEVAGPLNLAAVTTAKYFLPNYLGAFLRQHPNVVPQLKASNRERIIERLDANEDDLYIMVTLPQRDDIETHPFLDDHLVVFAHPEHPLAKKKNITLEQLSKERVIAREAGSGIRLTYERMLKEKGVSIEPYMELGSGEAIKQAVMSGIGIGALSTFSLKLELETGRLVVLDVEGFPISRRWHAVHRRGKRLSRAAQAFLEFIQEAEIPGVTQPLDLDD
ncbi:LysR family transcriptional regulator [Solemya pervernicosa gill symbiont]|uniref:LysR family transcriptional regulator n=2 Tax=Gammaproteobacteria incertae sedis TaxID=118884 RepID=A0A1T2L2D3_9GAMM|nr:LysR family transcriptional regulator [Candidatus Reidiella endopervernicosa]OOZ39249.1 LysR family transcriptional regulator [Solemya pervernicosa gill symbiont]QKQ25607.1 LysR family transcriptional regulator [Candidatus Reidiella endopervernicosa]